MDTTVSFYRYLYQSVGSVLVHILGELILVTETTIAETTSIFKAKIDVISAVFVLVADIVLTRNLQMIHLIFLIDSPPNIGANTH